MFHIVHNYQVTPHEVLKKILILHLDKYGIYHLLSCSSVFSDSNNSA